MSIDLFKMFNDGQRIRRQDILRRFSTSEQFTGDYWGILLKNTVSQMVYKHAISTVVPSRPVSHHSGGANPGTGGSNYHQSAGNGGAQQDTDGAE